ncbi:tryptophan synthase subunit alpha [Martelella mediterranea]|uniref:Tryptophan synthase alpha chain n=1 Tax=Martelella mediterranea DSM 17316 TaxID=1122214 RepID=A0A1U9Z716_9HYPH|nr:tryptophan synthase subunit alpha [Martelella mediterranea]AQZ53446.1 Tryptophan synthase alpha chain [Martelella mediterranea DSM 17316]
MARKTYKRENRIDAMFARLRKEKRTAFATFTVGGDPTFEESLARLKTFVEAGIDLIEIGYPFSDPILDGATIQKANRRAMAAGGNLSKTFELCTAFRKEDDTTPLVLMGYANPIIALGYERFAQKAAAAGIDGIIAADLSLREAGDLLKALARHGLYMIPLAAPTLEAKDFAVDQPGLGGFLYCIPVVGPTGGPSASQDAIAEAVERCRRQVRLPVMVGFGVKTPEMAAGVASVADGVIVATALIDAFVALEQEMPLADPAFQSRVAEKLAAFRAAI